MLAILGIALGAVLMNLNSEPPAEQKPPEKPQAAAAAAAAAPKSNKPVAKGNDDNLVIPELIPLNGGNKPKPPVKPPSKPSGNGGKPGEPVKVALVPPKEPTPKPAETPTPKPAETPTAKPTEPPPPKPPEPPPPKPEIKSPLGELPKVVDLPAAENTGPFAVGKISAPSGAAWQLALVGGDAAFKNSPRLTRKLVLQEKDPAPDKPSWQVVLSETSAADESKNKQQPAATFFRDGDTLTFQWLPDAEPLATGALRYCALAVKVGDDKKTVGLIKPKTVKPLVIDLQKSLAHSSVELDDVPQSKVRLEVLKLEGSEDFTKGFTVDMPKPLPPKSRGSLGLTMKAHPNKVDFPLMLVVNRTGLDVRLNVPSQIVAAYKNPPADIGLAKKECAKQRDDARGKIQPAKTVQEKVLWTTKSNAYDSMLAGLEFFEAANKVKVHFRVYLDAGEKQQVVLATTEGP